MEQGNQSTQRTVFIPPLETSEPAFAREGLSQRVLATLAVWWDRYRARTRLRHQLRYLDVGLEEKDIGLPAGSLTEEAGKPFWRE
ncbi:MAG: hypothetical protein R3175_08205 [Marinobacter sp.]|uniref:DUF1127 domain-containing protein n=1 Tax=Marinobacter sp. TaxID=50741 RepID=UPI00299DEAA8|nr:hypothetical protein [Marinobacter sp.]MDX1756023.1 hypothetical protein [Marinobacter sp.]